MRLVDGAAVGPPQPRLSPHDPSLKEALLMADFAGGRPPAVLPPGRTADI